MRDYLELYCPDGRVVWDAVLCIHEACLLVMSNGSSTWKIEVVLGFRGDDLRMVVRVGGQALDAAAPQHPVFEDNRARGLLLMSRLVDELEVRRGGLEVRLAVHRTLGSGEGYEIGRGEKVGDPTRTEAPPSERGLADAADLRLLVESASEGLALCELIEPEDRPVTYRILETNPAFRHHTGLDLPDIAGRLSDAPRGQGGPRVFVLRAPATGRDLRLIALGLGAGRFALLTEDVTVRRRAASALAEAAAALRDAATERRRLREALTSQAATIETCEAELAAQRRRSAGLNAEFAVLEGLRRQGSPHGNGDKPSGAPPTKGELRQAQELRERIGLAKALDAINRLLRSRLDFDEIVRRVLEGAAYALDTDACTLLLRDRAEWVVAYQWGLSVADVGTRLRGSAATDVSAAIAQGEPFAPADAPVIAEMGFPDGRDLRAVLGVPLVVRDVAIACLLLYSLRERSFADAEIDFARKLGAAVALALENARLRGE